MKAVRKPREAKPQIIPQAESVLDESLRNEDIGFRLILSNHLLKISHLMSSVTSRGNFFNLYVSVCGLDDLLEAQKDKDYDKEKTELEIWERDWKEKHMIKDGNVFERNRYNQKILQGFYIKYSRRLLRIIIRLMDRKNLQFETSVSEMVGG
jgi:hypothetical protein